MADQLIPIRNLYYLLCYAWNHLDQGRIVDVESTRSTELVDLFSVVLVRGLDHLARRGLQRGYAVREDDVRSIRGRIDCYATGRRFLREHGQAACIFDELTTDTLANRIIKTTLREIARERNLSVENRKAVGCMLRQFRDVEEISLSRQAFRSVQLNSNNQFYRFLLNICELVFESGLPDDRRGEHRFREFIRDEKKMASVFQQFVYNFLRIERPDVRVYRENLAWQAESSCIEDLELLPIMQTDVSVDALTRKIIIEVKYYRETLAEFHGVPKLRSSHLYQLYSYLASSCNQEKQIEGVLLYPTVDKHIDARYHINGAFIRVKTLDLAQSWQSIHQDLASIVN